MLHKDFLCIRGCQANIHCQRGARHATSLQQCCRSTGQNHKSFRTYHSETDSFNCASLTQARKTIALGPVQSSFFLLFLTIFYNLWCETIIQKENNLVWVILGQFRLNPPSSVEGAFYTQTSLHRNTRTHKPVYTQRLLHTEGFTHNTFTQMHLYTQTLLHTNIFTQKRSYTQTPFPAKGLLQHTINRNFTSVFADRPSFRAKGLLQHK